MEEIKMAIKKLKHNYIAEIIHSNKLHKNDDDELYEYMNNLHLNLDNGYVSLFKKISETEKNRWSIGAGEWDKLSKFYGEKDFYCSVNSLYAKGKHTSKYVKNLNALIVDLDYYNIPHLKGLTVEQVINLLEMDKNYPTPSLYVDSGQGLYIMWLLEKTVATNKSKRYWRKIEETLINHFQEFGADNKVKDPARVLRIPGTINSKTGRMVKIISNTNIRYELSDIAEFFWGYDIGAEEEKPKNNKPKKVNNLNQNTNITTLKTVKNLHYTRAIDIENLVKLRQNKPLEGIRENLLFIYRLQLLMANIEPEIALNKALELNNKFIDPLSSEEVINATKSANNNAELYFKLKLKYEEEKIKETLNIRLNKYLSDNGVYLYKNSRIIEELNINEIEMEHMKTLINSNIKKAHREISNLDYYLKNKDKINEMKKEKYQIKLKEQGKKTKKEELEETYKKIKSLKLKGFRNKEIAQELSLATKTLERHITYMKKNGLL